MGYPAYGKLWASGRPRIALAGRTWRRRICYNSAMKGRISAVSDQHSVDIVSHSATQTVRVGQQIGRLLKPGDLVLLFGTFGVGKTHFSKGLAAAFGVSEADVTSPTFVLVNTYRADKKHGHVAIHHIDLYRLEGGAADFDSIGLDELWDTDAICIIEWAERISDTMPSEYLGIQIDHLSETKRIMRITPHGPRYEPLLSILRGR